MSNNKHCGPDIVKYFIVEPNSGDSLTGVTGNFSVCDGILYANTIEGCTDDLTINGNLFNGDGSVLFSSTISACAGIYTSNIYGCSPITIHDELKLISVTNNNLLDRALVIDPITGLVQYRNLTSIVSGTTEVVDFTYNNSNTFTIERSDGLFLSATINQVTGLTVNGDITINDNTFVGNTIEPLVTDVVDIGTPIKRFRNINTISGTSTVWTSTNQVVTPNLNLGLDGLGNQRTITANNSIIQNDILLGGNY
jgi:hypothetical protein